MGYLLEIKKKKLKNVEKNIGKSMILKCHLNPCLIIN